MDRKLLLVFAPDLPGHDLSSRLMKKYGPQPPAKPENPQPAAQNQAQLPTQPSTQLPPRTSTPAASAPASATRCSAATESETVIENGVYRHCVYQSAAASSRDPQEIHRRQRRSARTRQRPRPPEQYGYPLTLWKLRRDPAQPSELRPLCGDQHSTTAPTEIEFAYATPKSRFRNLQFDANSYVVDVRPRLR